MSQIEDYRDLLKSYASKLTTLRDLRAKDTSINAVFSKLDRLTTEGVGHMSVDELLNHGSEIVGHSAYIKSKASFYSGLSKIADIAYSEVYDNAFLMFKSSETTATEARSQAKSFVRDAEIDASLQSQLASEWKVAAEAAQDLLIFIEVALKHNQQERITTSQA